MSITLQELGGLVRASRTDKGITQEELAKQVGNGVNRSVVAHFEQARRTPSDTALASICDFLSIPRSLWISFTYPEHRLRLDFEEALSELVGRSVSLRALDEESEHVANVAIASLFEGQRDEAKTLDALNSLLVFYSVKPQTPAFFLRYFGVESTKSADSFMSGVLRFQMDAIRLFSTFREAYLLMNEPGQLDSRLKPLIERDVAIFRNREAWDKIEEIPDERLPDLGYISARRARKERDERDIISQFLRTLADRVDHVGKNAINEISEKMRRKMGSLLRILDSRIQHDFLSPLFTPDADALRREADLLAPKAEGDLDRIAQTQSAAQRNLARYLSADHLDIYIATSMRSDADFVSVNQFAKSLFQHHDVKNLRLRYFNPTQSWIDDRVAKGLVEALMLRRASLTVYMAQKVDTFGKDSEASVALGQGKSVIVFVPKLYLPGTDIDSEAIGALTKTVLEELIIQEGEDDDKEPDPTMDLDALVSRLLTIRLSKLDRRDLTRIALAHWADFDLYGEDGRFLGEPERVLYRKWLDATIKRGSDDPPPTEIEEQIIGIFVAVSVRFEVRAKLFRETHPLALQIILSTGVLNGILVTRSVSSCAYLVEALIKNKLEFELKSEENNYRLVEVTTQSTARVISRNALITNAFSTFYTKEKITW